MAMFSQGRARVLFIGGPRDGQWQEAAWRDLPLLIQHAEAEPIDIATFCRTDTAYHLHPFALPSTGETIAVYVAQHVPLIQAHGEVLRMVNEVQSNPRSAWHLVHSARPEAPRLDELDPALIWYSCQGRQEDPHEEVRWQGGPDCWVCGQPGQEAVPPRLRDQELAPYGGIADRRPRPDPPGATRQAEG